MTEETVEFVDEVESAYSPLDDFEDASDVEETDGQLGPINSLNRPAYRQPVADNRPAPERIASLFERLESRKRVLRGILEYLDTPKRSDALQEKVVELQAHDYSVYDGYSYSNLLYEAGAINKVMEDGSEIPEDYEQAPDIVEIDGVEYYKPTDGVMVFWVTTQDARDFLAKDNPEERMQELLHDQAIYARIYKRVLDAATSPDGASAQIMADLVDNDPLCESPRRWSAFFTKRLEDCEALVWQGAWKITPIGKKAQEVLNEIILDVEKGE